jgi:hypothetical protein
MQEWQLTRPPLYPKQEAAIFDPARVSVIEASTKSGKTVGSMAWLLEQAWMGPRRGNHWWVAPFYPQAEIAYTRIRAGLDTATGPKVYTSNDTKLTIKLHINDAVMWFKSGEKPDGLYGEDVYSAVIDEATRVREESWWAIRTTLTATRGPIRIIGNVKGKKNWAYRLARRAENKEFGMAYHHITAWDAVEAGVLEREEIEMAEADLPDDVFKELYLAVASEDGANPFGKDYRVCMRPMSTNTPVVWGWDLARKKDFTVGIALDQFKHVCGFYREQKPWEELEDDILERTGDAYALVDATGVGDPVLDSLQRRAGQAVFEGFIFSQKSKQDLMHGLARDIKRAEIFFPEGPITNELSEFEYTHTRTGILYSAPEGMHDDCVCALALARKAFEDGNWFQVDLW